MKEIDAVNLDGEVYSITQIRAALASRPAEATSLERVEAWPSFEALIDLIGEFGREVHNLMDDCETSGPVGGEVHTITDYNLEKVSDLLDRIDALPFEEPGYILGTGAMLQAALKQTLQAHVDARRDRLYRILDEAQRETLAAYDVHPEAWQNDVERLAAVRATVDTICAALTPKASDEGEAAQIDRILKRAEDQFAQKPLHEQQFIDRFLRSDLDD